MGIFKQNSKMRKSSTSVKAVYNFGIPAFRSSTGLVTCPNAKDCISGCYARQGTYNFSNVKNAYEERLALTQDSRFEVIAGMELEKLFKKHGQALTIRIHDSGDFYSSDYLSRWLRIMSHYPMVSFYAYTKQVKLLKSVVLPRNFTVIYSMGGKQDSLVDQANDRHARVFSSSDDLSASGYTDATNDDMLAIGSQLKIGLVYHGNKGYTKTSFGKVG